ncbi:MAG: hypothetical protein IPH12_19305 [Saprospirales bacterium]|nr:hypothetical protein [Saprospirales bacterium]
MLMLNRIQPKKCAESPGPSIFLNRQQCASKVLKIVCKRTNAFSIWQAEKHWRGSLAHKSKGFSALQHSWNARLLTIFKTNLLRIATQIILNTNVA